MPAGKVGASAPEVFPDVQTSIKLVNQEFEKIHQKAATLYFNGHRATHIGNSFRWIAALLFTYGLLKEEPLLFPMAAATYRIGYSLKKWGEDAKVCAVDNPFTIPNPSNKGNYVKVLNYQPSPWN